MRASKGQFPETLGMLAPLRFANSVKKFLSPPPLYRWKKKNAAAVAQISESQDPVCRMCLQRIAV